MSKKYQIIDSNIVSNINSNGSDECMIFYLLYIVLFFVIVFIIYKIIFCFNLKKEGFENAPTQIDKNLANNKNNINKNEHIEIMEKLKEKNAELTNMKNTLQNKLLEQSQAIYINQNFNKVEPSSFNEQLSYLLLDFADTKFPELDIDGKKIINTQTEYNNILTEAKEMKNFYKPGDVVSENSTFGINKNHICYRQNNQPIKQTPDFIAKYPNCMVCAIEENNENLKNTPGWIHTKTNISKVCLYNPNAEPNSGIPNIEQCKTFCNINQSNNISNNSIQSNSK